ncbi:MAG: BAPKO_0422 family outer member beta-barrel protein [bacterium]
MKKYILGKIILFISIIIFLFSSIALAQNKTLGIGVIVGKPTGLSCKYWLSQGTAIDFAAEWSFGDRESGHIHGDYLLHRFDLVKIEERSFIVSYGIGARIWFKEDEDTRVGIRIPISLAYMFSRDPFEVFIEGAPIIDIAPKTKLDHNLGLGVRFYF